MMRVFFSWNILWRWIAAFFIPYLFLFLVITISADSINQSLGQLPLPRVGVENLQEIPVPLLTSLKAATTLKTEKVTNLKTAVENDSIDIGLLMKWDTTQGGVQQIITVYYNSMRDARAVREVVDLLNTHKDQLLQLNLKEIAPNRTLAPPVLIKKIDTFDGLLLLGKIMKQVQGGASHFFNFLLVLLVFWLIRQLVLKMPFSTSRYLKRNVLLILGGAVLAVILLFVGVQAGLRVEQIGVIKSLIIGLQRLMILEQFYPILLLWLPNLLFVICILGAITIGSATPIKAHERTFWMVVLLQLMPVLSWININEMDVFLYVLPVVNVFCIGQEQLSGGLDWSNWGIAFGSTFIEAVTLLLYWNWKYRQLKKVETK